MCKVYFKANMIRRQGIVIFAAFSCLEMQHMFCSEGSIGSINCLHYYFSPRWVHNCITKHVIVLNNRDHGFSIEKKTSLPVSILVYYTQTPAQW